MEKVRKGIMWATLLLLLISVMGCSLRIDLDLGRARGADSIQPEEAR